MARKRRLLVGRWACVMLAAVVLSPALHAQVTVPQYEVDPSWPKPLQIAGFLEGWRTCA